MKDPPNACPNGVCNSEHGPDEYAVGYFVMGDEENGYSIEQVAGEQAAHDAGRDRKLQIYWSEASAQDALHRLEGAVVTSPITGELIYDTSGKPAVFEPGKLITFDPATNTIVEK